MDRDAIKQCALEKLKYVKSTGYNLVMVDLRCIIKVVITLPLLVW